MNNIKQQNKIINKKSVTKPRIIQFNKNNIVSDKFYNIGNDWLAAKSTYNYMMKDPLLDWFKYHNKQIVEKTSIRNNHEFIPYIMNQGNIFEDKVVEYIRNKFGDENFKELNGLNCVKNSTNIEETVSEMIKGTPFIHSPIVANPIRKIYGVPDLLVRSDWLTKLINESPNVIDEVEMIKAPKLNKPWHYVVIDIKFTSLNLRSDGKHLLNTGCFPAYKSQLLIYNWCLGHLQGYTPNQVYVLGRRWKYESCGKIHTNNSCFDKLGIIDYSGKDKNFINETEKALKWLTEVKHPDAAQWNVTKYPLDRWELYPNMCNEYDFPWRKYKKQIADANDELTNMWMVGSKNRNTAIGNGVYKWTDEKCNAEVLGILGNKNSITLDEILNTNRSKTIKISPDKITCDLYNWQKEHKLEFYIDFESFNGSIFNIDDVTNASTENIIFMIGVGYIHPSTKIWKYKTFCAKTLTNKHEKQICKKLTKHISKVSKKHNVNIARCIHWSSAEITMWNNAMNKHNLNWKWSWMDLLKIFKEEPITIKGCLSFGLKDVATNMKRHGFIKSAWPDTTMNGQNVMVLVKEMNEYAITQNKILRSFDSIKRVIEYNKTDVKVLQEILQYLRQNHTKFKLRRKRDDSDSLNNSNKKIKI